MVFAISLLIFLLIDIKEVFGHPNEKLGPSTFTKEILADAPWRVNSSSESGK